MAEAARSPEQRCTLRRRGTVPRRGGRGGYITGAVDGAQRTEPSRGGSATAVNRGSGSRRSAAKADPCPDQNVCGQFVEHLRCPFAFDLDSLTGQEARALWTVIHERPCQAAVGQRLRLARDLATVDAMAGATAVRPGGSRWNLGLNGTVRRRLLPASLRPWPGHARQRSRGGTGPTPRDRVVQRGGGLFLRAAVGAGCLTRLFSRALRRGGVGLGRDGSSRPSVTSRSSSGHRCWASWVNTAQGPAHRGGQVRTAISSRQSRTATSPGPNIRISLGRRGEGGQ